MTGLTNSEKPIRESKLVRRLVAGAIAVVGATLVILSASANQRWLDRHFLPSFVVPRLWYVRIETTLRLAGAAAGAALAFGAPALAHRLARSPMQACRILLAALLALGLSEVVLERMQLGASEWLLHEEEPRRQPDARLGWTLAPSRTGHLRIGGRAIDYAIDPSGYRVRQAGESVDPSRPTIVFTGESIVFGEGLTWDESIPAQVSGLTGLQSANGAVNGYSNDQAYLRLVDELPHFRRPVAVVSLFMTVLLGRNMDDDRPHLGPGLIWHPAGSRTRLAALARILVPYRSDAVVASGIAMTRDVLRATIELSRARGAIPLIVVPHLGPEDEIERALRRRVLDDAGIPYLWVELDASWHLSNDEHPDARGAHAIAAAIANAYRQSNPRR